EHGFGEDAPVAPPAGTSVYSLFGRVTQPTRQMLSRVDVLVIDLQDVGVRPFTYATTMALTMEAARSAGKPVIVLDRPNPLGALPGDRGAMDRRRQAGRAPQPVQTARGDLLSDGGATAVFQTGVVRGATACDGPGAVQTADDDGVRAGRDPQDVWQPAGVQAPSARPGPV